MESIANRLEFAPPRDKGSLRAFGLALLVHVLLIAALTWGVNYGGHGQAELRTQALVALGRLNSVTKPG